MVSTYCRFLWYTLHVSIRWVHWSVAVAVLAGVLTAATAEGTAISTTSFVTARDGQFLLDNKPYKFAGANTYYLSQASREENVQLFADAHAMGFSVIRTWATPDQVTDLAQLDTTVALARSYGIRLILPLVNNWSDGMDRYVRAAGGTFHDQFFTSGVLRAEYKSWVRQVVDRYRGDPTIFAWELANEPRCSADDLPASSTCNSQILVNWAAEMSTYIKGLDPAHMVSVGDEGFLSARIASDYYYNGSEGVDHQKLTALPNVDFSTVHLYSEGWHRDIQWGAEWIVNQAKAARTVGKPMVLEEFGTIDQASRATSYRKWLEIAKQQGTSGWLVWQLDATGAPGPDQKYGFIRKSTVGELLTTEAHKLTS
jgi:mannan endo-1,4-beta-mannosidase